MFDDRRLVVDIKPPPADTGTCGGAMVTLPFTDVAGNIFFCQIAEAYFSGLTNGTTPTTYSPSRFCADATRWRRSSPGHRTRRSGGGADGQH